MSWGSLSDAAISSISASSISASSISASSISAAMLGADFYERVTRPGCALRPEPFLAYLEPGLDR